MQFALELSDYRLHGEGKAEHRASLAFESPVAQWGYAVSFLLPHIETPATIEIEAEITSGVAGFGVNDGSLSKYITQEIYVRPEVGRSIVCIAIDRAEPEMSLIVRNVSDKGENTRGTIYSFRVNSTNSRELRYPAAVSAEFPDVPYVDVTSELICKFDPYKGPVEADSFRNFLGVRTRCKYLTPPYQEWAGTMQKPPVGKHSDGLHDAAEWCGVLSAILEAKNEIVGVELGAGWAPWLVCATVAARQKGINKQRLIAVEANRKNIDFIGMHFSDNGINPGDHMIIQGMCSAAAGFNLTKLVIDLAVVDFIHVDIQGYELEVIGPVLPALGRKVRRLIVATHGRELDGKMFGLMSKSGWALEHEKMSVHRSPDLALVQDGAQVWKNRTFE